RRLDQWRVLRAVAENSRADRGRRHDLGTQAARNVGAVRTVAGLFSSRLLAADGYLARQEPPRRSLAVRHGAVEGMVMTPRQFWAGKRVFLTGHTGFKGGWLSTWLKDLGAELTGFAL